MARSLFGIVVICAAFCAAVAVGGCAEEGPPYAPDEALETFRLPDGYRIELVASEPQIGDPVAVAFDAEGHLYVVEMPAYPISEDSTGSVKLLEDLDDDGRYETSHVFADNLLFPHGVLPWKDGILVPDAPHMLYFEDTDGDHRADIRKRILSGFAEINPQLRANTPLYGLDNWIYVAYPRFGPGNRFPKYGDLGEAIHFPDYPEASRADPFSRGMDFRFKPDELKVEAVSGNSEYGLALNSRNHRFTSWNDQHARHVVIENKYLERNPYLAVGSSMAFIPDHGSPANVHPITAQPHLTEIRRASKANRIGTFTSACGQTVYTGGRFSSPYEGAYFVCEPVNNLVHSDRLIPLGATYDARRHMPEQEFLASTDLWFKPVSTTTGPDGALYVVDFYRKIVEHPEFIRKDYIDAHELFSQGRDMGRIYRVAHEEQGLSDRTPNLTNAVSRTLIDELSNPNRWWRITAQRLLIDRRDTLAVPALEKLAREDSSAVGRMHALWTLEGLDVLDIDLIIHGLDDESPLVREQAVRLAEDHLSDDSVSTALIRMVDDPDPRVQFQVACTLGGLPFEEAFPALQEIAFAHLNDSWFRTAVLTSAAETAPQWFRTVLQRDLSPDDQKGARAFVREITSIIGAKQESGEIENVLRAVNASLDRDDTWWHEAGLQGLSQGIDRGGDPSIALSGVGQRDLLQLLQVSDSTMKSLALSISERTELRSSEQLDRIVAAARETAFDDEAPVEERVFAIQTMGLRPTASVYSLLNSLLVPRELEPIQVAAAEVLAGAGETAVVERLIGKWQHYSAAVRSVVEQGLFAEAKHAAVVLQAVEDEQLPADRISRSGKTQLLSHRDSLVRSRAQDLLPEPTEQDFEDRIVDFTPAVSRKGDVETGEAIYREQCSQCHRVGDRGFKVGPDLATVSNRSKAYLLTQIIDPNENIPPGYESHVIETTDGRTISGVIVEETPTSLTIHGSGRTANTILRNSIAVIRPMDRSLMPVGLANDMTVQQMADLLTYLKSVR